MRYCAFRGGGQGDLDARGQRPIGDELLPGRRGRQLGTLQRSRDQLDEASMDSFSVLITRS